MLTKEFWIGFILAITLATGVVGWGYSKIDTNIIFPQKLIWGDENYVGFVGSIIDARRASSNGTVRGECSRAEQICRFFTIDQIGRNHVSQIYSETSTIKQWDSKMLRADTRGSNPDQCSFTELRIYFSTEAIFYSRFALKKDGNCTNANDDTIIRRIDDSLWWQARKRE